MPINTTIGSDSPVRYEYVGGDEKINNVTQISEIPANANGVYRLPSGELLSYVNGVGKSLSAKKTNTNTIALLGDSITLRNLPTATTASVNYGNDGYFTWANTILNWAFEIVGVSGNSGQETAYILTRVDADIIPLSPNYCFVLAGTNNVNSTTTVDSTIADLKAIYTKLLAAGITPIAASIPPRNLTDTGMTAARKTKIHQINRWISEYCKANNLIFCDLYRAVANPQTGEYIAAGEFGALSPTSTDGIHPLTYAGYLFGVEIASRLQSIINKNRLFQGPQGNAANPYDIMYSAANGVNAYGNIIANGGMHGTTGVITAPATGSAADNWSTQNQVIPTAGAITLSKVQKSSGFGAWQQIAISGATGNNPGTFSIRTDQDVVSAAGQVGPTTWQVGDQVYAQMSFETDAAGWAGSDGLTDNLMSLHIQCFGSSPELRGSWGVNGTPTNWKFRPNNGVMRTPTITIPPLTTRLYIWFYFRGQGVVRISDAELRKVITL